MDNFRFGYLHGVGAAGLEHERRTSMGNAPDAARNNAPRLLERVKVRVLESFYVGGKVVEPGERIELSRADAESMAALRRVELLP